MNKTELLKEIGRLGYNIGFSAKLHFSTFDIVNKIPNLLNLTATAAGVFGLFIDFFTNKQISAVLVLLGVIGFLIGYYGDNKDKYCEVGKQLIDQYNELRKLYAKTKTGNNKNLTKTVSQIKALEQKANSIMIGKQIFFANWYAHYKFFWQQQIDWLEEGREFKLWRDKIPLTFSMFCAFMSVAIILLVLHFICKWV